MQKAFAFLLFVGAAVSHTQMTKLTVGGVDRDDCLRMNADPEAWKGSGFYESFPIMMNGGPPDLPQGILSDNYTCGFTPYSQQAASAQCNVNPGDTLYLNYYHGGGYTGETKELDNWIAHSHYGPIMISMAKMEGTNPKGAKWFKVWQKSILSWNIDGSKSEWASAIYLNQHGGKVDFQIPSDLAPGKYFLRTELLALHSASESGGAQPYIRCAELNVGGSGSVTPEQIEAAGYSMTIPSDSYAKLDSPGILYNVWWNSPNPYPYPGGDKVYVAGSLGGSPTPTNAPTPNPTLAPTPAPTPAPTNAPAGSTSGAPAYDGHILKSESYLKQGVKLWDNSKAYYAKVKADGRLVIVSNRKILWSSGKADGANKGIYTLSATNAGKLFVYQTSVDPWTPYWTAPVTSSSDNAFSLILTSDGNLRFQDSQGKAIWSSNLNVDLGASINDTETDTDEDYQVDPFSVSGSSSNVVGIFVLIVSAFVALLF